MEYSQSAVKYCRTTKSRLNRHLNRNIQTNHSIKTEMAKMPTMPAVMSKSKIATTATLDETTEMTEMTEMMTYQFNFNSIRKRKWIGKNTFRLVCDDGIGKGAKSAGRRHWLLLAETGQSKTPGHPHLHAPPLFLSLYANEHRPLGSASIAFFMQMSCSYANELLFSTAFRWYSPCWLVPQNRLPAILIFRALTIDLINYQWLIYILLIIIAVCGRSCFLAIDNFASKIDRLMLRLEYRLIIANAS